ncbi:MAG TPA: class I SAM-dependent methyltransferase [Gemmatimonadaceae bacterium]
MDRGIIEANRSYLNSIPQWINDADYRASRSGYGCPERLLPLLNLPIDNALTYTDLLVDAAARMAGSVDYLEIGVSVGKNFFVMANALHDARLYGVDWERINPTLERRFELVGARAPVAHYRFRTNDITYVQGDVFDDEAWCALAGRRFNVIFSDACHQQHALLREFEMLRQLDLIDRTKLFMLWDDLDRDPDGPVSRAFWHIAGMLRSELDIPDDGAFMLQANGWLGQHEHTHTVGVINSIGLTTRSY